MDLREKLALLVEMNVVRAEFEMGELKSVQFAPQRGAGVAGATTTTFTDPATGDPVDLNEGAPELARDDVDGAIAARNFERGKSS